MSIATGRPNAAGFVDSTHLIWVSGPEYEDAIGYLEPAAVRRLGFAYLHATDAWVASLPDWAQGWLKNPRLFEPLIRDGTDALYRIQPAFLRLTPMPAPQSFESLRQAVPASAAVYLSAALNRLDSVRLASVLAHTRLLGVVDLSEFHFLTDFPTEPLDARFPDIVVIPQGSTTFLTPGIPGFPPIWRNPVTIWRGHRLFAYASSPTIAPEIDSPRQQETNAAFVVHLSDVYLAADTITFTATFADRAPERWTGQDWLVIEVDETPWALPTGYEADGFTNVGRLWFAGQIVPSGGMVSHRYEFNARMKRLAVGDGDGVFAARASSGEVLAPGAYVLAVRLRLDHLQAAVIPVLRFVISEAGAVTYTVYEGERSAGVNACPALLQHTDSCRRLAGNGATAGS